MSKIPITLIAQKSKLENLTLREPIDIKILNKLIKSDLLLNSFNNPMATYTFSNEREQLIAYKKLIVNGYANVKYNKVKNIAFGRANPNNALGLHNIRRQIRHTLAVDTMVDIDIENAHPTFLYQICKANDIECSNLGDYILNRQDYLNEVIQTYKVSRDNAKKLFIKLLYFGSFETWASDLKIDLEPTLKIKNFKSEIEKIGKSIVKHNQDLLKIIKKRKSELKITEFNEIGTTVSYYLQEIECQILETIYSYCVEDNIINNNIAVLCADGLMIKKENYKPELLNIFSDIIYDKFGLKLIFTQKPLNEGYLDILDEHLLTDDQINSLTLKDYQIEKFDNLNEDFKIMKLQKYFDNDLEILGCEKYINNYHLTNSFNYFNSYFAHFYFTNSIYHIFKNTITGCSKDFETSFQQLNFEYQKKNYKFMSLYLSSKYKKIYSTFDFEPLKTIEDDKYNLFQKFIYDDGRTDYNLDVISPYLEHIKYACKDEVDSYNYVLNWIAHIFQKPNIKIKTAIILYSQGEGYGKNIIFEILEKLLEGYYTKFKKTSDIGSKFNSNMMGKLFVLGDEIDARVSELNEELKDMITRNYEIIEFKGKDKIQVNDYKNYIFTTNNEMAFKISPTDRRFMLIEFPDDKKDYNYFKNLYEFKDNNEALRQLYNYFKTRNIKEFIPSQIVKTEYKQNLILNNLPSYLRYLKDEYSSICDKEFTLTELYKDIQDYATIKRLNRSFTDRLLSTVYKKLFSDYSFLNKDRKVSYKFPKNKEENILNIIKKTL